MTEKSNFDDKQKLKERVILIHNRTTNVAAAKEN